MLKRDEIESYLKDIIDPASVLLMLDIIDTRLDQIKSETEEVIGVKSAEIRDGYLYIILTNDNEIRVGYVKGESGKDGYIPNHKWDGTCLKFEKPDGTWGECVELRGPPGPPGPISGGAGGVGTPIITRLLTQNQGQNVNFRTEEIDFTGDVQVTKTGNTSVEVAINRRDLAWFTVTSNSQMVNNAGYVASNTSLLLELNLPKKAKVGDKVKIMGFGLGGFKITQNSGQRLYFGNKHSSIGIAGFIQTVQIRSAISIICVNENKDFMVESSIGNFKIG